MISNKEQSNANAKEEVEAYRNQLAQAERQIRELQASVDRAIAEKEAFAQKANGDKEAAVERAFRESAASIERALKEKDAALNARESMAAEAKTHQTQCVQLGFDNLVCVTFSYFFPFYMLLTFSNSNFLMRSHGLVYENRCLSYYWLTAI